MGEDLILFDSTQLVSSHRLVQISSDVIECIKNDVIQKMTVEIEMSRSESSSSDEDRKNIFLLSKEKEAGCEQN